MKINSVSTDSCEDGGGEEDRLEVVPVLGVVLSHDVYPSYHHLAQGNLVLAQQLLHTDTITLSG